MSKTVTLTAGDGHRLAAYRADPPDKPRGGLVVIQEIFGVNRHMRSIVEGFAADGYAAIAPALFDRASPGVELGYEQHDMQTGRDLRAKIAWDKVLLDVKAAQAAVAASGKVGVIGYCWGGSVAFLAATRLEGFAVAIGYYGGQIAPFANEKPRCTLMLHFGETDAGIPMADVAAIRAAQGKAAEIHVYPAGHGFNCEERASYHVDSARLARQRSLAFLRAAIG